MSRDRDPSESETGGFFDRQHEGDLLPLPLHYRLLRRFETSRVAVADRLLPSGSALLDIGCGEGELARTVATRFRTVVATDVSEAAIAKAKGQGGAQNIRWQTLDASGALPFSDGSFDAIVSLSTLQYLFDPQAFLRECFRLLEPGGTLLIEVPNMAYLPQRLRLLAGRPIRTSFWRHGIDGGNLHYFTVDLLRDLIAGAGFTIDEIMGSGVFAQLRTWRVSLLCGNIFVRALKAR